MGDEILNTNGYKEAVVKKEPVNGGYAKQEDGGTWTFSLPVHIRFICI